MQWFSVNISLWSGWLAGWLLSHTALQDLGQVTRIIEQSIDEKIMSGMKNQISSFQQDPIRNGSLAQLSSGAIEFCLQEASF